MEEWTDAAFYQITELAKKDPEYLQLLEQCRVAERKYLAVMDRLSPEDQQQIEDYFALCEDLDHRMTCIAYNFGKSRI